MCATCLHLNKVHDVRFTETYLATSCKIFPNKNPEHKQMGLSFLSEFHMEPLRQFQTAEKKQGGPCCRFVRHIFRQTEECLGTLSEFAPTKTAFSTGSIHSVNVACWKVALQYHDRMFDSARKSPGKLSPRLAQDFHINRFSLKLSC